MDDVPLDLNLPQVPQPNRTVTYVPPSQEPSDANVEIFRTGGMTIKVLEDGSHTDNRLGIIEMTIPPHSRGPPAHWHQMHDEIFLGRRGRLRFHVPAGCGVGEPSTDPEFPGRYMDCGEGGTVTVPTHAPHTFSNPFDEEAVFVCTLSPAYYVGYLRLVNKMVQAGEAMGPALNTRAMAQYATISADLSK